MVESEVQVLVPTSRDYAFGGERLRRYGKRLEGRTAETWEFSVYPGRESRLAMGGERLDAYLERVWGPGAAERAGLPLVKLLDVAGELPVHCHPSDAQALSMDGTDPGKDEAWLVLEAGPEAAVFLGFEAPLDDLEVARAVADGSLRSRMTRLVPRPGDVVMVPRGVAHSARDVVLWEVQETSDRSLLAERADLWDRPFAPAEARAALDAFLSVARRGPPPPGLYAPAVLTERVLDGPLALAGCDHFVMAALDAGADVTLEAGAYTVLGGTVETREVRVDAGQSFLVGPDPARLGALDGGARLLRAWRPDATAKAALLAVGRHFEAL